MLLTGAVFGQFGNKDMKLINTKTGDVVVEMDHGEVVFHDRFLQKAMEKKGILIPPALQDEFGGKTYVRLGDPDFEKAFKEVFFNMSMNPSKYHWEE